MRDAKDEREADVDEVDVALLLADILNDGEPDGVEVELAECVWVYCGESETGTVADTGIVNVTRPEKEIFDVPVAIALAVILDDTVGVVVVETCAESVVVETPEAELDEELEADMELEPLTEIEEDTVNEWVFDAVIVLVAVEFEEDDGDEVGVRVLGFVRVIWFTEGDTDDDTETVLETISFDGDSSGVTVTRLDALPDDDRDGSTLDGVGVTEGLFDTLAEPEGEDVDEVDIVCVSVNDLEFLGDCESERVGDGDDERVMTRVAVFIEVTVTVQEPEADDVRVSNVEDAEGVGVATSVAESTADSV